MSWENVSLKDVSPTFDLIEAGDFELQILPGAKLDNRGGINIQLSIASTGPFSGRRLFISYPDPSLPSMAWSTGALKRLEQSVGLDQEDGEGMLDYINRLGASFAKFTAPVYIREYQNDAGETIKRNEVKLFKVRPAA